MNYGPPKDIEILTSSVPVNKDFFENKVFTDDQIMMRSWKWSLIQYDSVLMKK